MSTTQADNFNPASLPRRTSTGRRWLDRVFVIFCMCIALLSVVVLAALILSILVKGLGYLSWRFLTSIPDPSPALAGIWPGLGGTVWVCIVCAVFTLPIGVATAIFLEEFRPHHRALQYFHSIVQLNITNLSGVPSVVYGILGLTAFVGMFGLFSTAKQPYFQVGVQWVDQFGAANSDGQWTVVIPVARQSAPAVEVEAGIEAQTKFGEQPMRLIGPFEVAPRSPKERAATVRLGSTPLPAELDGKYFDEFTSFAGSKILVELASASAPPTKVVPPLKAYVEQGEQPYIRILASDEVPTVTIYADTELARVESAEGFADVFEHNGQEVLRIAVESDGAYHFAAVPQRVEVDGKYFDQFVTEDKQKLRVPVDGPDAPLNILMDGAEMSAQTETGQAVQLAANSVPLPDALKSGFDLMLREAPVASRQSRPYWYYLRLPFGASVLAGGLTLMLVILPIVIIAAQEALRAVPNSLREGALGMGATPWQVVWNITLPAALPGIMTGSILAMSRAIGEAAPILIICGIVTIGYAPGNLMDLFTVMPLQIYDWAGQPDPGFQNVAGAGIIVLLSVLLTFNAIAVFIRQKLQKPLS